MASVIYKRKCVVCGRIFTLRDVSEPLPEHERQDVPLPCNGSLHPGEMLGQELASGSD